jgi:hypothetical protein
MASTTTLPTGPTGAFPLITWVSGPTVGTAAVGTAASGSRPALGTNAALVTLTWPDNAANTVKIVGSTEVFLNWLRQVEQLLGG